MSRDSGTYNTLAFPSWALHMPWFREKLEESLVLDPALCDGQAFKKNDSGHWVVDNDVQRHQTGPWWHIEGEVLGIGYDTEETNLTDLIADLNTVGIPHDIYEDTDGVRVVCEKTLGKVNGSVCRSKGVSALTEFSLPDQGIVQRWPDTRLLAMLESGQVAEVQEHLKAVIASLRQIDPLDKNPLDLRSQLAEAFICTAGCALAPGDLRDLVAENPGLVVSLSTSEKDRAMATLCVNGEATTLVAMINAGFVIDPDAPKRIAQMLADQCDPAFEKPNPMMLTHLTAVCARNRAMDVLSEMKDHGPAHPTP